MSFVHPEDLFIEATDRPSVTRPKILIVDDDQSLREFLEILLAKEGYGVCSAPSGQKALRLMDKENVSLVISDVRMPGIDGMTLLEEIESVLSLMKQRKKLPKADVKTDVPADLQFEVDPSQFKQVLLNLVLNAYQALPHEDGRISIKGTTKGGDHLVLKISDNGTSIRPEDLSRVFNPFFSTRPDGTGLGLAIVHRLVHEWNGDITVDSEQGKGSTFTLHLPKRMKGIEN